MKIKEKTEMFLKENKDELIIGTVITIVGCLGFKLGQKDILDTFFRDFILNPTVIVNIKNRD